MIKFFIVLLSFFNVTVVLAAERPAISAYFLNKEMRFERNDQQEVADVKPASFAIGYRLDKISLSLQYSDYQEKTGNTVYSVERHHSDLMLWGNYYFFNHQPISSIQFQFFAGVGAGSYNETINTSFQGSGREDAAKPKFLSGINLGSQVFFKVTDNFKFVLNLEGRALMSADFDPNPMPSAIARLGIEAPL